MALRVGDVLFFQHPISGEIKVSFEMLVEKNHHIKKEDVERFFPESANDIYFLAYIKPTPFERIIARKENGFCVIGNKNKFNKTRGQSL